MAIKAVTKERIDRALAVFDRDYRDTPQWREWHLSQAHRYAINVGGTLYPAKKVVSLATGIPVIDFHGGRETNTYLEKRGFEVVELPRGKQAPVLQFTPDALYDRKTEINGPFGGSRQSGIASSAQYPAVFLFTGDTGEQYGYADHWEKGAYFYTGEGQRGPMTLTRGNRAIADHAKDGKALHLFHALGKGKGCRYIGEFACAGIIERTQPDVEGKDRTALVFQLVPVVANESPREEDVEQDAPALPTSLEAARVAALQACNPSVSEPGETGPRKLYQRSRKVSHYVQLRADGVCESCRKPAPFHRKDGTPYLEPHHVNRLSDGGLDHPRYVGAICPSCHREIHSGVNGGEVNERLKQWLAQNEVA
ncbi:HNH endonuclease [Pseudomonas sp. KNUC1026]|uniref:HNH endonuclease n=1 Tax=Pseudomonas sp. KNUC1026 TaxID=2893890 RepID=UPI001F3496BE|nr:HNH endonuclease signature motif containing protein [Pseudomonas sp. KNUC1026]UFH49914.1 HNH endonuclease [Pseudomonas sp. KNUC1026]